MRRSRTGLSLLKFAMLVATPIIYHYTCVWGLPDIGDPFDVQDFGSIRVDHDDNALSEYDAASRMIIPIPKESDGDFHTELNIAKNQGWSATSNEFRTLFLKNRPALDSWRRGTEKPDLQFKPAIELKSARPSDMNYDLLKPFQMADVYASYLLDERQTDEAWLWCRARYRFSRHWCRYGAIEQRLLGVRWHAEAVDSIVNWLQQLSLSDDILVLALTSVQDDFQLTPPLSWTFKCEYICHRNTLPTVDFPVAFFDNKRNKKLASIYWYIHNEPELSERVMKQIFANVLEQVDLPLSERQQGSTVTGLFQPIPNRELPDGRLTADDIERFHRRAAYNFFQNHFKTVIKNVMIEQARQRALEICLAARIYHKRKSVFPENLDELVAAGILDEIPLDPFSPTGDAMKYKREAGAIIVWSIGENKRDDDGIIEPPHKGGDSPDCGLRLGHERDQQANQSVE